MAELKTKPQKISVIKYISTLEDGHKKKDAQVLLKLMKEITGKKPVLWGTSIIGFGSYHYKYASGREGDWPLTGFSIRKQNISIYLMDGCKTYQELLKELGPHKTGVSCLYVKKLADIDISLLKKIVSLSYKAMCKKYNC